MQLVGLPPFDSTARHVASRPFTFDGKKYDRGDAFDVRANLRRAESMYHRRKIQQDHTPTPGAHIVLPRGGGWYDVQNAEGEVVNDRPMRLGEATVFAKGSSK